MRTVMPGRLAGAFACLMAAALPASAEPEDSDIAGRWITTGAEAEETCGYAGCELTYDVAPCGNGWCGIEVKADNTCGRTALRLDAGASTQYGITFLGSYERAPATQPYNIRARLIAQPRATAQGRLMLLHVQGTTEGKFEPFQRFYPTKMVMTRAGDAVCRPETKTS